MHLRQVELYNLRVLTTCKLYAFQHKQVLQKITASYWDKKKIHKIALLPQHNNSWTKAKSKEHATIGPTLIPFFDSNMSEKLVC